MCGSTGRVLSSREPLDSTGIVKTVSLFKSLTDVLFSPDDMDDVDERGLHPEVELESGKRLDVLGDGGNIWQIARLVGFVWWNTFPTIGNDITSTAGTLWRGVRTVWLVPLTRLRVVEDDDVFVVGIFPVSW